MTVAHAFYLGYPVEVTDHAYIVTVGGTRVRFQSMHRLRAYVRGIRKLERTEERS